MRRALLLPLLLALLPACEADQEELRADALVRRYNAQLIEAYRTADPELVEMVAGPEEAKKITGLIGVKLDQGITLDSTLIELTVVDTSREKDAVIVTTREHWKYVDRRIGNGVVVGEPSEDHYVMRYTLERVDGLRKVTKVDFVEEPKVGRTVVQNSAPADVLHGVGTSAP